MSDVPDDGLPPHWSLETCRSMFLKWLDSFARVVETAAAGPDVWRQTRDAQDLLARLARRLGFDHGPIARRTESFTLVTSEGREIHNRDWIIATDPTVPSVTERYDGWVHYPEAGSRQFAGFTFTGPHQVIQMNKSSTAEEEEFLQQVLLRVAKWRQAVLHSSDGSRSEPARADAEKRRTV